MTTRAAAPSRKSTLRRARARVAAAFQSIGIAVSGPLAYERTRQWIRSSGSAWGRVLG